MSQSLTRCSCIRLHPIVITLYPNNEINFCFHKTWFTMQKTRLTHQFVLERWLTQEYCNLIDQQHLVTPISDHNPPCPNHDHTQMMPSIFFIKSNNYAKNQINWSICIQDRSTYERRNLFKLTGSSHSQFWPYLI